MDRAGRYGVMDAYSPPRVAGATVDTGKANVEMQAVISGDMLGIAARNVKKNPHSTGSD